MTDVRPDGSTDRLDSVISEMHVAEVHGTPVDLETVVRWRDELSRYRYPGSEERYASFQRFNQQPRRKRGRRRRRERSVR